MTEANSKPQTRDLVTLALLWLATRAVPFYWLIQRFARTCHFEVNEVEKLLEYGFWQRKGALLRPLFCAGHLADPAAHNYVHHPYPVFWLYSLLYSFSGKAGIYVFIALTGLLGCVLVYTVLLRFASRRSALFAAALFTVAHSTLEFDVNPDFVAQATIFWPIALLVLSGAAASKRELSRRECWLLGLATFVAGQMSWWALGTVPALMIWCLPEKVDLAEVLKHPFRIPAWRTMVLGGIASMVVFILQVRLYSPATPEDHNYLLEQMGINGVISRWNPVMAFRLMLAGPALWVGVLAAFANWRKLAAANRLLLGALIYFAIVGVSCLILPGWFGRNQDPFRFVLFPCALLTALALDQPRTVWLRYATVAVSLPALLFCYSKLQTVDVASNASETLATWVAAHTQPADVILSNRKTASGAVQPTDVEFGNTTRRMADRLLLTAITDSQLAASTVRPLLHNGGRLYFLREPDQPLSRELSAFLEQNSKLVIQTNLPVPPEPLYLYSYLRGHLFAKFKVRGSQAMTQQSDPVFHLELLELEPSGVAAWLARPATNANLQSNVY